MIIDDETYTPRGRALGPAMLPLAVTVLAFEPMPALVDEVPTPTMLISGAWSWVMRRVLGSKVSAVKAKLAYAVNRQVLAESIEIMREKQIAPAAWLAWYAGKRCSAATAPLPMASILGADWLKEGRKRAWFRTETTGLFGGRAVIVGDPPGATATQFARDAYAAWALTEKDRMQRSWTLSSTHGALFPNADLACLKDKKR